MSAMPAHAYRLFGLNFSSDLELPGLHRATDHRYDFAVTQVERIEGAEGVFDVEAVASYHVPDDRTIEVSPAIHSNPGDVRLFLLGTAMGMLLYRRGDLPLHANAILVADRAWLFLGESGAGKSTLAASLKRAGHRLLSDDVCVVRSIGDGGAVVVGGVPRMRLWEDAANHAGYDTTRLELSVPGDPDYRKFDVPIAADAGLDQAPLEVLCLLEWGEQWAIGELSGAEAVEALFAHSYRGEYVDTLGDVERHWRQCIELAQRTRCFRYVRPRNLDRMDRYNRDALADIGTRLRSSRS